MTLARNPMMMSNVKRMSSDFFMSIEHDFDHSNFLFTSLKKLKTITTSLTIFNFIIFNGNLIIFLIFAFTHEHLLLLPVYIPFIDHETSLGYLLNISFHITIGLIGFHTFTSFDASIILYGHHGSVMLKVFVGKFNDLEVILRNDEGQTEVKKKLESMIENYEEYREYFKEFERMVKMPFEMAILMNSCGLILCILVGLNVSVLLGVGGSIGLFIGFLLPCILMTFIESQVCRKNIFPPLNNFRIFLFRN